MDPTGDEHLDFGELEYGGSQKMPFHTGGAISALADEDDECDDLYNDVNVGEGFMQIQQSRAPLPPVDVGNGGFQGNVPGSRGETATAHRVKIPGSVAGGNYPISGIRFQGQKSGLTPDIGPTPSVDVSQRGRTEMVHSSQAGHLGYQGPISTPQNVGLALYETSERVAIQPIKALNSGGGGSRVNPPMPTNQISVAGNVNIIQPLTMDNQMRPAIDNGNTMVFVGELHWWTTDAELENVLTQYGRVKEIKFYDERASGKSKGYCQAEFFDSSAAAACKEHMNGHPFNGRACVVELASPQTIKQVAASYASKNPQPQSQPQGRRPLNDGSGRGNGTNFPNGDAGRGYGRGWGGRGGQGMPNKGPGTGPGRGRGAIGPKMMNPQGMMGPGFDPTFMGRGMMGPGFDPTFMGRGAGYGGFTAPPFHPGMMPPFPAVNHMGLAGVAPHVNPAFFGRGMTANGMNMMGPTGMDGPHAGMWPADTNMVQRGGDRTRESSYGGEDDASDYEYGEASQDKGARSNAASRGSERDYERKHRDEREHDRDHRYREEKDSHRDYRHKERNPGHEDDRERGQPSKSRRSRAVPEEDHRSRSRDADYGKRRRLPSE